MVLALQTDCRSVERWLYQYHARVDGHFGSDAPSVVNCSEFNGQNLSIIRTSFADTSRVLATSPDDTLTFCIASSGFFRGLAGGREILMSPKSFAFLLLPGECLRVLTDAQEVSVVIFQLRATYLSAQAVASGTSFPNLLSLHETIPGHEELILACASQLFKFSALKGNDSQRQSILSSLEDSITSLLITLIGICFEDLPRIQPDTPHQLHVDKALKFMNSNLATSITLKTLCMHCCVSARTLQISFQSVMGKTPLQVLQELRYTRLHDLILHGLDVGPACEQVGVRHTGRLSAKYKEFIGELPRETRAKRV